MSMLKTEKYTSGVELKATLPDRTTRLDPPHHTAADQDVNNSVSQEIDNGVERCEAQGNVLDTLTTNSVRVVEQLRTHANQLATHLQEQKQDLDDREARLHAQMAAQENESRTARIHFTEREKQLELWEQLLEQREKSLDSRERELENKTRIAQSRASAAEEKAQSAEHQVRAAEEKAQSAEHQARAAEIRTLEAETQARVAETEASVAESKKLETEQHIHNTQKWAQLSQAVKIPSVSQNLSMGDDATSHKSDFEKETYLATTDVRVGTVGVDSVEDIRSQIKQHDEDYLRQRYRTLSAELIKKKEILDRRGEALDQRGAEVDQLRRKVMSLHKETLEMRLVTEELWIRISGRMSSTAMTRGLAELKTKMSEHYRLAGEHLAQKQIELETLSAKLNKRYHTLDEDRKKLQHWFQDRGREFEEQSAHLDHREQELNRLDDQ